MRLTGGRGAAQGLAVILHAPATVELLVRRRGRDGLLGRFSLDPTGIAALRATVAGRKLPSATLSVTADLLLEQQAVLPLAAERDPERVLRYEMDRITPFTADELFWTWAVSRSDRANGRLHIRLSLVPRARLAPVLDALRGAGIRPVAIVAPAPDGLRRIALGPAQPLQRRALAWASAVAALLAITAAALPFVAQALGGARIERQITALRPQVEEAEALRRRALANAAGSDVLAEQRGRGGNVLATLALLTQLLPDDTYLTELSLRARVLTMSGQSAAAARLIAALAGDPGLRNPAFAAPVTRGDGNRNEGFSIRAEVAP